MGKYESEHHRFLILKLILWEIKHKKIVHKIHNLYNLSYTIRVT